MVTPFNIWEYSLIFSDKTKQLKTVFFCEEIQEIPKFILSDMNWDLYLYCLKKWWLTIEEVDDTIFIRFKQLLELNWKWINLEHIFKHFDYNKNLNLIDYIYNL